MNDDILKELEQQAWELPIYPDPRYPPSLYYRFLYALTYHLKPQASVELGTCGGGAALHMALGYPDGLVVSVDIVNAYPENVKTVLQVCPNFQFWQMDSFEAASHYRERMLPPVSVLFIDTVHTYDRTMLEFAAWRPNLTSDAVVCLDDLFREGMLDAWNDLPGNKLRLDKLHIGGSPEDGGFGVLYDIPVEAK